MSALVYFFSRRYLRFAAVPLSLLALSATVSAATLSVGPGMPFAAPCAAFNAAADGDTVEIDAAGSYVGNVCGISKNHLTIRGVNGRPKIDAGGQNSMGKGIWVVGGTGTVIENVEMFGAAVVNKNGAAIRLDGHDLTLRGVYLHDNENGILTNNDLVSNIIVENSEFAHNGAGDGRSHNLYIGQVNSLLFKGNFSHSANIGHDLKSRAQTNTIVYNRFSNSIGRPSYEIDLPNAGTAYVIGNVIQQGIDNDNSTLLAYGMEGASNAATDLYVVNNTFLNDDPSRGTFINVGSGVATPVLMQNNMFIGTGTTITQAGAVDKNNYKSMIAPVVDRANYDLHPDSVTGSTTLINLGSNPGLAASGFSLTPDAQYKHVAGMEARPVTGPLTIGAYEPLATVAAVSVRNVSEWNYCAQESGMCSFSGTHQVRYGANGVFAYKSATNSVGCNNEVFGDPLFGTVKHCEYSTATTTSAASEWNYCAQESGLCSFNGTHQVRFGANGVFTYKAATYSIGCNDAVFGDPLFGTVKYCEYSTAAITNPSAMPEWNYCAQESGTCSFSGTHQVRYGANGVFAYKSATDSVDCNNEVFGDPLFGTVKYCEYSSADSIASPF